MNDKRRKEIDRLRDQLIDICDLINAIRQNEREYFDNIPVNLQDSDQAGYSEGAIDLLEQAAECTDQAMMLLDEAGSEE